MRPGAWVPALVIALVASAAAVTGFWMQVPIAVAGVAFTACALAYPRLALIVWLLAAPAATSYARLSLPGGVPDITFSRAAIALVGIALLLRVRLQGRRIIPMGPVEVAMGVLLFVLGADVALRAANVPSELLQHFDERITPLLLFLFARSLFSGPGDPRRLLRILAVVGLMLSVHGTYQYLFTAGAPSVTGATESAARSEGGQRSNESHLESGRAVGPFENAVEYGGVAAIVLGAMLVLALETKGWPRTVSALLLAAAGVATVLSLTRSVWLGAALGVVTLALVERRRRAPLIVGSAVVLAALLGGFFLLDADSPLRERTTSDEPVSGRLLMYQTAVELAAERPLTGYGSGAPSRQAARRKLSERGGTETALAPGEFHDVFLKTLVEWGVVGLAALVVILTLFVRGALALRRRLAGEQNDAYHFAAVFLFATAVYVVQGLFTDTPPFLYLNGLYFFLAGVVYAQLDACDAASEQGTVAVGLSATARA